MINQNRRSIVNIIHNFASLSDLEGDFNEFASQFSHLLTGMELAYMCRYWHKLKRDLQLIRDNNNKDALLAFKRLLA